MVTSKNNVHIGFALATLMLTFMGWTLYQASSNEIESSRWISHTRDVLQEIAKINEGISRAESAQRGYLLSGTASYTSERDEVMGQVNNSVAQIKRMTSDNPVQQRRVPELEKLIATRIAIMQETEQMYRAGDIQIGIFRASSEVGKNASARIYDLTKVIKQEEQGLLEFRQAEEKRLRKYQLAVLLVMALLGALILIPGYIGYVLLARVREQTERKLRVMADSLPGEMYQLRHPPQGVPSFTFMSAGATNIRGISVATLPAWETLVNNIDERDRQAFLVALEESKQSLTTFRQEYRVKHTNGTEKWLHHEAVLQKQADGHILMNGYVTDITQQRRLAEALQEARQAAESANRAKSTFLATMSHEIRTPMNGVLGMLELLSLTKLDREQRTTLEIVRVSSKSLLRIIDDILDFSKIEAGKLEVRPEVASIRDVIEDVHNIYSGNASSKGLLIKRSADPRISPAVLVDPVRLRQILNNFVSNALKFTTQGHIEVTADLIDRADGEDRVRFSVKDTGIGISAENQKQLFQAFSQADGDSSRRASGTGLGLTICRRIADLMGGSVEMESALGKGTTMILTLSLPIADPEDLPKADTDGVRDWLSTTTSTRRIAPSVVDAQAEGTLVLLVDDHPTNRTVLMRQVHTLGYAAESAEDGLEALGKWTPGRFGIVITDCNMPEMDGYELTRRIRALESNNGNHRIPIIACTANALGGDAEACFAAGMDDYLAKPVELAMLLKKLDQWLPIPRDAAVPGASTNKPMDATLTNGNPATPVDRSVLAEISGGDAAVERDLLIDFRRVNDEDAAMLKQAVDASNLPQITRTTHRIKGASAIVGAVALASVCERIEQASRANEWTTVVANMQAFQQEWTRLNTYLDAI